MSSTLAILASLLAAALGYVLGSIPFAVLVSRAMGLNDPRTYGSRNPGATNVLRTGNKTAAALTLLGDAAKGWLAVWLAQLATQAWELPQYTPALVAITAFLGHVYPLFLRFKGGKGVATALGVVLALQPWLALATAATWLIVAYATRYSSLAALAAAIFTPLYYLFGAQVAWKLDGFVCSALVVLAVLLCFRHQANIGRLLSGKESRIGAASSSTTPSTDRKRSR